MEVLLNCYPASADRIQDEEAAISWTRSLVCQGQAGPLRQAAVLWDLNLWFLKIFHWRCWKFNLEPSASCFSYCLILSLQRSHAGIRHAQVQIPKLRKINACAGLLKYKNGPGSNFLFLVSCWNIWNCCLPNQTTHPSGSVSSTQTHSRSPGSSQSFRLSQHFPPENLKLKTLWIETKELLYATQVLHDINTDQQLFPKTKMNI